MRRIPLTAGTHVPQWDVRRVFHLEVNGKAICLCFTIFPINMQDILARDAGLCQTFTFRVCFVLRNSKLCGKKPLGDSFFKITRSNVQYLWHQQSYQLSRVNLSCAPEQSLTLTFQFSTSHRYRSKLLVWRSPRQPIWTASCNGSKLRVNGWSWVVITAEKHVCVNRLSLSEKKSVANPIHYQVYRF
jgi:hypothetical protein